MSEASNKIPESNDAACSYNDVSAGTEPNPELSTNKEWRAKMITVRVQRGWSQDALASELGISQALVSKIESGETAASKHVMPICRLLNISPPEHFVDDAERTWMYLGRSLREISEDTAIAARELIEQMLSALKKR